MWMTLVLFIQWTPAKEVPLPEKVLTFSNGTRLQVEVAETPHTRERGLMERSSLADGRGMLFVFPTEQFLSFWMKNTYIALSIAYISKDLRIVDILDMSPPLGPVADDKLKSYPSSKVAKYAVEVPQGWFGKNKIKVGTSIKISK